MVIVVVWSDVAVDAEHYNVVPHLCTIWDLLI